jgi:hypothetical protein
MRREISDLPAPDFSSVPKEETCAEEGCEFFEPIAWTVRRAQPSGSQWGAARRFQLGNQRATCRVWQAIWREAFGERLAG